MKNENLENRMETYRSAEELRREIAELKIQLAFQEEHEAEVEKILRECQQPDPELIAFIDQEEAGLLEEIGQHFKKRKCARVRQHLCSTVGRIAAILVVGALISISSAIAAVQMVRLGIFEVDIRNDDSYISINASQQNSYTPEEWKGEYYPTYIPEGFKLDFVNSMGVRYIDSDGNTLEFDEISCEYGVNIDTNNVGKSGIQINGTDAMLVERDGLVTIIWSIENRCLFVKMEGEKETALRIAESVGKTKR